MGHELQAGELCQQISNNEWLNKNQRGTDVKLVAGRGERPSSRAQPRLRQDPRQLIAVKDLNVCTIQYVDNGLSFLR